VSVDEAKARELVEQNPKLRLAEDGTDQSLENAIQKLLKTVHIQVWERFKYEVLETQGALRIDLKVPRDADV
jgi:hypothetical protein